MRLVKTLNSGMYIVVSSWGNTTGTRDSKGTWNNVSGQCISDPQSLCQLCIWQPSVVQLALLGQCRKQLLGWCKSSMGSVALLCWSCSWGLLSCRRTISSTFIAAAVTFIIAVVAAAISITMITAFTAAAVPITMTITCIAAAVSNTLQCRVSQNSSMS